MDSFELLLKKDLIAFKMVHDNMDYTTKQEKLLKERIHNLITKINEFIEFSNKNRSTFNNHLDSNADPSRYVELKSKEEQMGKEMMEDMEDIINVMHELVDESIMANFEWLYENPIVDSNLNYDYEL